MKDIVNIDDFAKLDLRVGEIVEATGVPGSEKLLGLLVNFGEEIGKRTIYAGIKAWYEPASLIGRKLIFIINLEPRKFKISGVEYESQGMMVAAGGDRAYLYSFDGDLPVGTVLR